MSHLCPDCDEICFCAPGEINETDCTHTCPDLDDEDDDHEDESDA